MPGTALLSAYLQADYGINTIASVDVILSIEMNCSNR
jgi:hypothetical protein